MSGLIALALAIPLVTAAAIWLFGERPGWREAISLVGSVLFCIACVTLALSLDKQPVWVIGGEAAFPPIVFRLEPLGAMFACIAGSLWPLNSLYSVGYMRSGKNSNLTRFYLCFALALFGALGVALAGNLYTLFIFYEILTLSTYPLVAHKGDAAAKKAGTIYLAALLGTSLLLFLPAVIATGLLAGSTDFVEGGLLHGHVSPNIAGLLLVLFVFGVGKAAVIPVHFWLPRAMVAPTPVSALLHAVAVVKAGVFVILKLAIYVFGADLLRDIPIRIPLVMVVLAGLVFSSLVALTRDNLKARLAWSTIGQLAYVTIGALLANASAWTGAAVQILAHAYGKMTLFMCAGAIYIATGLTKVSELRGLGRRLPWVFIAFAIAAASVCGLPPFAGAWPKFLLLRGAWQDEQMFAFIALLLSSIFAALYLLPIAIIALFPPKDAGNDTPINDGHPGAAQEAVIPLLVTAAASIGLFFLIPTIAASLAAITGDVS